MPLTIASDIAQKSFRALLERVEQNGHFSPDEVQQVLASCEMGSAVLDRLWHLVEGFLDRGVERKKLASFLREVLDVIDVSTTTFDAVHERVRLAEITPEETSKAISQIDGQTRRAVQMRDRLSALLRRLEASPSHITPPSLPSSSGEKEAEGFIDLQELTTRLLSNGDT